MSSGAPPEKFAPDECIVCGEPHPVAGVNVPGWTYLVRCKPIGAIACSQECLRQALARWTRTGRVDGV
jgi:hypothetical protein